MAYLIAEVPGGSHQTCGEKRDKSFRGGGRAGRGRSDHPGRVSGVPTPTEELDSRNTPRKERPRDDGRSPSVRVPTPSLTALTPLPGLTEVETWRRSKIDEDQTRLSGSFHERRPSRRRKLLPRSGHQA